MAERNRGGEQLAVLCSIWVNCFSLSILFIHISFLYFDCFTLVLWIYEIHKNIIYILWGTWGTWGWGNQKFCIQKMESISNIKFFLKSSSSLSSFSSFPSSPPNLAHNMIAVTIQWCGAMGTQTSVNYVWMPVALGSCRMLLLWPMLPSM